MNKKEGIKMNVLKNTMKIIVMAMVIFLISNHMVISQDKYYCRLGPQPLVKCDSIVSIKFDPLTPMPDYGAFATEIEALDENIAPIEVENKFVIYSVQEGYDIDTSVPHPSGVKSKILQYRSFKAMHSNFSKISYFVANSFKSRYQLCP
jgi:hypothetical protein